jgi:hypothetical protein
LASEVYLLKIAKNRVASEVRVWKLRHTVWHENLACGNRATLFGAKTPRVEITPNSVAQKPRVWKSRHTV